jgi:hypothetical protein
MLEFAIASSWESYYRAEFKYDFRSLNGIYKWCI